MVSTNKSIEFVMSPGTSLDNWIIPASLPKNIFKWWWERSIFSVSLPNHWGSFGRRRWPRPCSGAFWLQNWQRPCSPGGCWIGSHAIKRVVCDLASIIEVAERLSSVHVISNLGTLHEETRSSLTPRYATHWIIRSSSRCDWMQVCAKGENHSTWLFVTMGVIRLVLLKTILFQFLLNPFPT